MNSTFSPLVNLLLSKLIQSGNIKASAKNRLRVIHAYFFEQRGRSGTMRHCQTGFTLVDRWLKRWQDQQPLITEWFKPVKGETRSPTADREFLLSLVEDAPRSGAPPRFDPEVADQVIALALTKPENYGIPFDRWTHELLAKQVVINKIAPEMSSTRVGDFLKSARRSAPSDHVL